MRISEERLLCSECIVAPEIVKEEGAKDVARCPLCGASGDLEAVVQAAAEYQKGQLLKKHIEASEVGRRFKSLGSITYNAPNGHIPVFIFDPG